MTVDDAIATLGRAVTTLTRCREWLPGKGPTDSEVVEVRDALAAWRRELERKQKARK